MYMPGRSRTGSSPSRTVMSLAVYVASLIEKALETARFRAPQILPEPAVGIPSREARCGRLCNDFAEVLVADSGGELGRARAVLRRGRRDVSRGPLRLGRRLRQRPHDEAQLRRCELAERVPDPAL